MDIDNNQEFEALCARLLPKFNEYLQRHSKNIFSCELATSLDGISSMPALYSLKGVQKQVIAPLELLTKDVDVKIEEAKQATEAANTAAGKANDAAASVTQATLDLTTERKKVEDAVNASKTQTEAAKQATEATLASKADIESNETKRQDAETTRQSQETARVNAEKKRVATESERVTAENNRATAETKRQEDTKAVIKDCKDKTATAIANSKAQTDLAKELNDHPPKMGDNGNWHQWDFSSHAYVDTGIIARGGAMYPAFKQHRNKLLMIDYSSHVAEHVVKRRNKLIIKV